ncbi:MarR family transcriptional regulator [Kitasatospora sp. NPDC058965]|uniref:MarR family transcriptional regulator n=1 Tax=Kitasatospora sp. NPDC058965 TaxID=3346682 RepID=UPI0036A562B4
MSEIVDRALPPPLPVTARPGGPRVDFARILAGGSRELRSGTLLVAGDPGGSFHLRDGAIVEVTSPGAPGADTLLLRSGRVSESEWASVCHAGAGDGGIGVELIARDLVGAAEWQLICVMAAVDGALAVGLGRIDGLTLDGEGCGDCLAALEGVEPDWLLRETERRIRALRSPGHAFSPFHDRLVRTDAGAAFLGRSTTGDRREILRRADGRRSARDIAFLLGRSLYAVLVEVSRLLGEGLLATGPAGGSPGGAGPPPAGRLARTTPAPDHPVAAPAPLPQRLPGASGITEVLPLRPAAGAWRPPSALVAKYRAGGGTG